MEKERIVIIAAGERFTQVGTCHLREPLTGAFLGEPEPIYIKERHDGKTTPTSEALSSGQIDALNGVAAIFAAKHREYVHGVKRIDKVNRVGAETPEDALTANAEALERRKKGGG